MPAPPMVFYILQSTFQRKDDLVYLISLYKLSLISPAINAGKMFVSILPDKSIYYQIFLSV
jgi:hypothetical protein